MLPTTAGIAWGSTDENVSCSRVAPVATTASRGPDSTSSTASAMSFAMKPMEPMASASVPATGPRPMAMMNTMARISSGIPRSATSA